MVSGSGARGVSVTVYRRRRWAVTLSVLSTLVVASVAATALFGSRSASRSSSRSSGRTIAAPRAQLPRTGARDTGVGSLLRPGSDPSVLPGPLLIADRGNNRLLEIDPMGRTLWTFPRPGDLAPGQTFNIPDDAFFTPDGQHIIVTQEDDFVVSLIDMRAHRIVWRYGMPGVHGSGPDRLWNPDDAIVLPNGEVLTADIKNCRLVIIPAGAHAPRQVYGRVGRCRHAPPARFGSPNGAFPMRNGHLLVTEINGDWVDEIDLAGHVYFSTHPPLIRYPSDTNEVGPDEYLTVDSAKAGAIETFDHQGRLLWRYAPPGADHLDKPSLAKPLPNGDIIANDDNNHRVIVVDPSTNRIVWQYGHTGAPGTGPGWLNTPDGMDFAPPHSLAATIPGPTP